MTFVARWCPAYTDIFANRARNDIVESLQDLGPNTQYDDTGILINPAYEKMPPQDRCQPIPQWQFTLGTGYQSRAVTGVWGSLSKVTDPYSTRIVTRVLTPLLNDDGSLVPFRFLAGAVTIRLTRDQAEAAGEPDRLWAQGGTPDDPVLAQKFGTVDAPEYAFGTLRCASDNLNGDNVEFIYFPAGVTHVFCYAFYVKPPPPSGTITITKHVVGAPAGHTLSSCSPAVVPGASRSIQVGSRSPTHESATFYRAAGNPGTPLPTWTVTENPVAGYTTSVSCQALAPGGGPGQSVSDVNGANVDDPPGGGRARHMHVHEHLRPADRRSRDRQDHPGRGRDVRLRRGPGVGSRGHTASVHHHYRARRARAERRPDDAGARRLPDPSSEYPNHPAGRGGA